MLREGADVVAGVVLCDVLMSSRSDETRVANSIGGREELLDVANRLSRIDVQLILAVICEAGSVRWRGFVVFVQCLSSAVVLLSC